MSDRNASRTKAAVVPPSPKVIGLRAVAAMPTSANLSRPDFVRCTFGEATTQLFDRRQFRLVARLSFQSLEIGDHVRDLARIEPELRHCRMTGDDALSESF